MKIRLRLWRSKDKKNLDRKGYVFSVHSSNEMLLVLHELVCEWIFKTIDKSTEFSLMIFGLLIPSP